MIDFSYTAELTRQDLKEKFAGSALGMLWMFLWPLVQLFIYVVIFGKIMGGRLPGNSQVYAYGIYAACGLIPWTCFATTLTRTSRVFIDRKNIISKIPTSLGSFPLYICISESIPYFFSLAVLFIVAVMTDINLNYLYVPSILVIFYVQQVLAFSLGLFCATLSVFFRDISEMVNIAIQLWFWFTPIVYTTSILPDFAKTMVAFNPMYAIVESMHNIFVFNTAPPWKELLVVTVAAHLGLLLSLWLLKKLERDVRDFL